MKLVTLMNNCAVNDEEANSSSGSDQEMEEEEEVEGCMMCCEQVSILFFSGLSNSAGRQRQRQ